MAAKPGLMIVTSSATMVLAKGGSKLEATTTILAGIPQAYGTREASEASRSSNPNYTFNNGYDLHAPVQLQLSQPQTPKNDAPAKSMKLGYKFQKWHICKQEFNGGGRRATGGGL
ncbi:hypothetical protein CCACVL1_10288 [Corchorus capsularis]|uniref:Uncharacterized protein n=1 Tax=Corchorus capsularis TaxID=210143 RepID=A0A1R3IRT5_COCAP|nr:hypothetical protein CCACVL1_10288 [Corchorus capsularis]